MLTRTHMGVRMIQASAIALGALTVPAASAEEFSTQWAASAKSQARLVAADEGLAGFEIRLAPGAITYWRDPGDAGAPPAFDFSGSDNVAKVEPVFPAPERIAESDGSEAFGYQSGSNLAAADRASRPGEARDAGCRRQLCCLRKNLPAGESPPEADPARRRLALRASGRGGPRSRSAVPSRPRNSES